MERISRFQGTWYPADPAKLRRIADTGSKHGRSRIAVLPHAGLLYSAALIREYFETLSPSVRRILIISPSHYHYLKPGQIVSSSFTSSRTPLGSIPTIPVKAGINNNGYIQDEHGVEMFLPFIAAKGLSVSYLLLSSLSSEENAAEAADTVLSLMDEGTGLIASSDFTHYGPAYSYMPYGIQGYDDAVNEDRKTALLLAEGNAMEAWRRGRNGTICGIAAAVAASLAASRLSLEGEAGKTATSADANGDRTNFVSYCTVLWKER